LRANCGSILLWLLVRHLSSIHAGRKDHFLQADFPLLIAFSPDCNQIPVRLIQPRQWITTISHARKKEAEMKLAIVGRTVSQAGA